MTVGELLDRMSSREISEWMAIDRHEPIGQARLDYLTAAQLFLIAKAGGAKTAKFEDFEFDWWRDERGPQTREEMDLVFMRIAAMNKPPGENSGNDQQARHITVS